MNKIPIFLTLMLLATLLLGSTSSYASENQDDNELKIDAVLGVNANANFFEVSGEGKNKTQFRIKNSHQDEDENSEFMLKGVISAFSSNSLTIDQKLINIDPSITEEVKIVGEIEVGAYAMVKGIVIDSNSNFYAAEIVVNQRNKNNIEEDTEDIEEDENANLSASLTAQNVALEKSEKGGVEKSFNMKTLLENLRSILNSFRNFVLSV